MTANLSEYQKYFDIAINKTENLLWKLKSFIINFDETEVDLNDTDYNGIIYLLENRIDTYRKLRVIYKYDRMNKEEFDLTLRNTAEGKATNLLSIAVEHQLKSFETPQSLITLYNISFDDILHYNGINSTQFDDYLERNAKIKIPINVNVKDRVVYNNLPVYGSHSGTAAWGTDWANEISFDPRTGRVKVLSNIDTLIQGVNNRFGNYGDIPGYEDQVISFPVGEDLPSEAVEAMTLAKISESFNIEARIQKVQDILIVSDTQDRTAKRVTIKLVPINSRLQDIVSIDKQYNSKTVLM